MRQLLTAGLALFALTLVGAETAVAQESAIEEKLAQYESRFNAGDAEGVAELFAEEVVYYDALGRIHEGRDAVRQMYQENLAAGFQDMSVEAVEIVVDGDTAYDIARYTITAPDGETIEGHHLAILTRVDGDWKVERTLVNARMPD